MNDKNNWEEISNDVNEVAKKIKKKIDSEDLVDDLKESFKATIQNTSEIFNSILTTMEKTVKDQEIKEETKSLIKKINIEFSGIKVINLGSSCIYPLDAKNPIKESDFMTGSLEPTNSPYAMAKLSAIEIGRSLKAQYGHKVINLMPTNLYGPNDNFDENSSHVIPGLIRRMNNAKLNNEDTFEIWGTGKPLREFLYVDDLANAVEFILNKNIQDDLINIGSGEEISILKLAELIKDVIGYEEAQREKVLIDNNLLNPTWENPS